MTTAGPMIRAVVFDLDGVLLDSELVWDLARRAVVAEHGGRWDGERSTATQRIRRGAEAGLGYNDHHDHDDPARVDHPDDTVSSGREPAGSLSLSRTGDLPRDP